MQEKRKSPRIKDNLIVVCKIPEGGALETIEQSEDISDNGIRITIPKSVAPGDVISFEINLFEDSIPIPVKGKIIWKNKALSMDKLKPENAGHDVAGLQFSSIAPLQQARIKDYFKRKNRKANARP